MLDERLVEQCKRNVEDIRGFDRCETVSVEEGRFEMRAYPGPDCANRYGQVHGGFLLAIADEAASGAADTHGYDNVTMAVSANFLRPARIDDEYISFVATLQHAGRRSVVAEVVASRPDGEVVLKATYTMAAFETRLGE